MILKDWKRTSIGESRGALSLRLFCDVQQKNVTIKESEVNRENVVS
jgi:hypothetical protein